MALKKTQKRRLQVELDDETDRLLVIIAKKKNITISDAVRTSIRQAAESDLTSKIADRLVEIDLRIAASANANTAQIETLSKQFLALMEAYKNNTNLIAMGLNKLLERGK